MFKIRNKDGLFSNGGRWPSWTKIGKVWRNMGALSGHLAQIANQDFYSDNDEVIGFEPVEVSIELLVDYNEGRLERGKERKEQQEQHRLLCEKDHLNRELARIQGRLDSLK